MSSLLNYSHITHRSLIRKVKIDEAHHIRSETTFESCLSGAEDEGRGLNLTMWSGDCGAGSSAVTALRQHFKAKASVLQGLRVDWSRAAAPPHSGGGHTHTHSSLSQPRQRHHRDCHHDSTAAFLTCLLLSLLSFCSL